MSALYVMRYLGQSGIGMGAIYIGKGKIAGVDVANGRYLGSYTEENGRLKGQATLSLPTGGSLVTGQQLPPGASIRLAADWPLNFGNGQAQQLTVEGRPVQVTFEKIADIP
jgi:hypothetical protein